MAESNGIFDGATITVSTDPYGYPGANTIDGDVTTFWHSDSVGPPHWIKFDLGEGNEKAAGNYQLASRSTGEHEFKDWLFQGSNNDVDWVTLDEQVDQVFTPGVSREFACANTTNYRYYRFWVTETQSQYACMGEIGADDNTIDQPDPACYLEAPRRDRLCWKGVSTNNKLS